MAYDGAKDDEFGYGVDISGDYIVVSSRVGNTVYIYHRTGLNTWGDVTTKTIVYPGNVSIHGDYFAVSAASIDCTPLYHRTGTNTWELSAVIPVGGTYRRISLYNDYLVFGDAPVTVYHRIGTDTWDDVTTEISNPNPDPPDAFGVSVSTNGNFLVVGASLQNYPLPPDTLSLRYSGAVYFFERTGVNSWNNVGYYQNPVPVLGCPLASYDNHYLGSSVAIHGNYIIVGADGEDKCDPLISETGGAYLFNRFNSRVVRISPSTTSTSFGYSADVSGNRIIVGAPGGAIGAIKGRAYIYEIPDEIYESSSSSSGSSSSCSCSSCSCSSSSCSCSSCSCSSSSSCSCSCSCSSSSSSNGA